MYINELKDEIIVITVVFIQKPIPPSIGLEQNYVVFLKNMLVF
jgi:hypothetical protein